MIYQIRGTNGAGKTYVVQKLISAYGGAQAIVTQRPDRKEPSIVGYNLAKKPLRELSIVGPYETPSGGLDTFSWKGAADWIFSTVKQFHERWNNVVYEGIIYSADGARTRNLVEEGYPVTPIFLTTTLPECIEHINARRAEKGRGPLENHNNVIDKYDSVLKTRELMFELGLPVKDLSSDEAVSFILGELRKA